MDKEKSTYKLPDGWLLVRIEEISKHISDGSHNPPKAIDTGIPMLSARNIENNKITFDEVRYITPEDFKYENQRTNIELGDVLLTIVATIGRSAFISENYNKKFALQRSVAVIKPVINGKFLMYCFHSPLFQKQLTDNAKGTAQKGVYLKTLRGLEIPLPPLKEQFRIVSRIEELFSELDHAEKGLLKAKQQLEVYKQAMLKKAFEGKLTNKEVKPGELPKRWKWVKIDEISNVVRGGSPRPAGDPKYYGGNIPFLKVRDITKDTGIYIYTYEFTIKEAGLHKTRQIKPNTLLLSNSGATLGVPKICMINATMNDGIAAFLDLDKRSNLYLFYFWLSKTKELRNINMGAAQPNLNTDIIENYLVPYCSFEEQQQIVQVLERYFSLCDKLEVTINQNIVQLATLRQSILKKAFSGKLVPQDNLDEPASKLLERIRKEREEYSENQKKLKNVEKRKTKIIMAEEMKTILQLLQESNRPIAAKTLWQSSIHKDDIDVFYSKLKELIEKGKVVETERKGKESYLTLAEAK